MPDDVRSLYRRWRSRTFSELIGQEHVSQTLLNALETGRVAHAYLFSGPRGSGKTSTARILAKAVNCLNNGGKGEPCDTCEMCRAISEGRALDLIEIDAASNRGIDEIRDLRDKVHFAPTTARYKVYILDEAHMLTNEAFNALLKTLEEPPPHVIFALVTTESHKIPPTIVSRCQRFDFHRATTRDLLAKLNRICQEEHIKVEPAALSIIARTATGSYRDAESLLDQLASFTGDDGISVTYLQHVLGLAPLDAAGKLVGCIANHDVTGGIQLLSSILQGGADIRQFGRDVIDYLRNMLLIKTNNEALLDITDEAIAGMKAQAKALAVPELVRIIKLFSDPDVSSGLRASIQPQLPLELAFIEACSSPAEAVAPPPAHAPITHSQPAAPASVSRADPPAAHTAPPTRPAAGAPAPTMTSAPARPAPTTTSAPARPAPAPTTSSAPARPTSVRPVTTTARPQTKMAVTAPPGSPLAAVQENWPAILDSVKSASRSVEAFLKECRPVEADGENIELAFNYPFHRDSVDNPKNRALVEDAMSAVLVHTVHVRCTLAAKDTQSAGAAHVLKDKTASSPEDAVVKMAEQVFDAKVIGVEKLS
jgi:DNA polymerase-3 subunit gamma/tau